MAIILFVFDVVEVLHDEVFDEHLCWVVEGDSSVGYEFCNEPVVISAAGGSVVFSEIVHFCSYSDEGSSGGFVQAVFWQLFCGTRHGCGK